jgi:hypothetical protein
MSALKSNQAEATRRFERLVRREWLRTALIVAGILFLVVGVLLRIRPFGAPISNPAVIPKSDPHAGLLLIQSLPSNSGSTVGLCLVLLGALSLLLYWLMGKSSQKADVATEDESSPNNSLERTREG